MSDVKALKVTSYKVKDGDSLDSIAKAHGTTWQQLGKFNWGTDVPDEINKYLRARVGCTKKTKDGNNYIFTSNDDPGIIYIPEKAPEKTYPTNTTHPVTLKKPKLQVPTHARAFVKFRPHPGWKGEYGFDWLRCADTSLPGDVDYKTIVGKYPPNRDPDYNNPGTIITNPPTQFNNLAARFQPFAVSNFLDSNKRPTVNYASFLSLFPADAKSGGANEAKILADINVKEGTPLAMTFESDTSNFTDFVSISAELQKSTGKQEITIKSKKASPNDIVLRAMNHTNEKDGKEVAYEAGRLIVCKNAPANRKELKVVFVSIVTNINGTVSSISTARLNSEKTFLTKYLHQGLITLKLKKIQMDLSKPPNWWTKILQFFGIVKSFNEKWVIDDGSGAKVIANYSNSGMAIHEFLEDKFDEMNPGYQDWFKVFFFEERGGYFAGGNYRGLNGGARDIPSKSVALYSTHNTSTTTHELLHAIGLYHSFSNSGTFTYKKNTTDNIMDYSHQNNPPIDRISTWKWQWEKLQSLL